VRFFSTHRRPLSTFVALSRGLQRAYPMSKDPPDSIAQAFARLDYKGQADAAWSR